MANVLLVLVQSVRVDTYVNVLTHCVRHENVEAVIFVGKDGLSEESVNLENQVRKISSRLRELADSHDLYKPVGQALPPDGKVDSRLAVVDFARPYQTIAKLANSFGSPESVIIDVTAVSTEVSANVISSILVTGLKRVCCLTLDDQVYQQGYTARPDGLLYHNLIADPDRRLYSYPNIALSSSTRWAQRQIRIRAALVNGLLALSAVLMITVVILLAAGRSVPAQVFAVLSVVATVIGLIASIISLSEWLTERAVHLTSSRRD